MTDKAQAPEEPQVTAEKVDTTKSANKKSIARLITPSIALILVLTSVSIYMGWAKSLFGLNIGMGPGFALGLVTSFFILASFVGFKGALIFVYFGPPHLLQHLQIEKALKILEGKIKTTREIEFMQGQKIYSAWKPALILLFARIYYEFGGNEVILGWVFVFCLLYMIAIMGIDAGRILLVAIPLGIIVLGYAVYNEVERAGAIEQFWGKAKAAFFESGMQYVPLTADIIVGFVICLILVSLAYHKFFSLNFGFYRNQYTVGIFIRRSRSFPKEQMVLDNDVPDAFEDLLDRMSTVLYIGVQSGIDSHFFYCVPFGNKVHSVISRATSRQNVFEG